MRRIYFAFRPSNRIVIMDYAIDPQPVYSLDRPHKKLFEMISENDISYEKILRQAQSFRERFFSINEASNEMDISQPAWNNNYVPGLDIIVLYTLINQLKPDRYVEIGSGTTTKTALKARKENDLNFTITCIDPHPRQEIAAIADEWMPTAIQEQSLDLFRNLSENDIVFFDGTHTLYPNSDVMWFFMEILPVLPPGVVVQVHDIYLPYDYPQFMRERYYSENYLLGALLLNNPGKYEIMAPVYYMSEQESLSGILNDVWVHPSMKNVETHGGSFWFRIK